MAVNQSQSMMLFVKLLLKKNKFLVNVRINSLPADSSAGSRRELQAALVLEKQTSADLRDLVNIRRQQHMSMTFCFITDATCKPNEQSFHDDCSRHRSNASVMVFSAKKVYDRDFMTDFWTLKDSYL
jgi:hypothetical protein